nr:ATP-binding protein [Thiosulfatihalobacter marinus]
MADLFEILGAILENAARHARQSVRVGARKQGKAVTVTIQDDGAGIAQDKIATLQRRGARADESGTGLGLAIARDLAESLGGSVDLAPADPGLVVRITLPLSAI